MKASMQKLIAMGLCVVLAVGSLTGCGGSSNDAVSYTHLTLPTICSV